MDTMLMRTPSGGVISAPDWTDAEPLYSSVEIDDGAIQPLVAFSYGKGQVVPGSNSRLATHIDTNFEGEGGRLPWTEEALIFSIAVEFYLDGVEGADVLGGPALEPDVSLLNMLRLQEQLLLSWRSTYTRELFRAPVGYFPAGSGISSVRSEYTTDDLTNVPVIANNGGTSAEDMRRLATPIYIPADDTFSVELSPATGTIIGLALSGAASRIFTRIFLEGYRRKPS